MKTAHDIQLLVNQLLKDWLPCKSKPIHVKIVAGKNPTSIATVGAHVVKDGLMYREDYSQIDLKVHESFFNLPEAVQQRTITHETYHVIQRNLYTLSELRVMRQTLVEDGSVSMYAPNILELEAEVFCINICGSSNHSCTNAKMKPLYRETLDRILNR